MHEERLRQLRRVVENVPDESFHMGRYYTRRPCGTAYCAAGHAALDGWFQDNTQILEIFMIAEDYQGWAYIVPIGGDCFVRLGELFAIEGGEASDLFGSKLTWDQTASKEDVIANIDRLLTGKPTVPYDPKEVVL